MSTDNKTTFAATVDAIQKLGESLIPAGFDIVEIESVRPGYDDEMEEGVSLTVKVRIGLEAIRAQSPV
jgi:hypothetical protein